MPSIYSGFPKWLVYRAYQVRSELSSKLKCSVDVVMNDYRIGFDVNSREDDKLATKKIVTEFFKKSYPGALFELTDSQDGGVYVKLNHWGYEWLRPERK